MGEIFGEGSSGILKMKLSETYCTWETSAAGSISGYMQAKCRLSIRLGIRLSFGLSIRLSLGANEHRELTRGNGGIGF